MLSSSPSLPSPPSPTTHTKSNLPEEQQDELCSLSSSVGTRSSTQQESASSSTSTTSSSTTSAERGRSSIQLPFLFPSRLYEMLRDCDQDPDGIGTVVSWLPDGKAFKVHNVKVLVETILPFYFNQSKYKSFQRQLNLWDFDRIATEKRGSYFHPHFSRDQPLEYEKLRRTRAIKKIPAKERRRMAGQQQEQEQLNKKRQVQRDTQQKEGDCSNAADSCPKKGTKITFNKNITDSSPMISEVTIPRISQNGTSTTRGSISRGTTHDGNTSNSNNLEKNDSQGHIPDRISRTTTVTKAAVRPLPGIFSHSLISAEGTPADSSSRSTTSALIPEYRRDEQRTCFHWEHERQSCGKTDHRLHCPEELLLLLSPPYPFHTRPTMVFTADDDDDDDEHSCSFKALPLVPAMDKRTAPEISNPSGSQQHSSPFPVNCHLFMGDTEEKQGNMANDVILSSSLPMMILEDEDEAMSSSMTSSLISSYFENDCFMPLFPFLDDEQEPQLQEHQHNSCLQGPEFTLMTEEPQ